MKKYEIILISLILTIVPHIYCQEFDSEADFRWVKSGNGVTITRYVGTNTNIRIPPRIQGIPVTRIGKSAFDAFNGVINYKRRLTSVTIPDSVVFIDDYAFQSNHLTSIVIPDGVTSIGTSAFGSNDLSSVIIPAGVTTIGGTAFARNQLVDVTIPNKVSLIGERAFSQNRLTSITIPDSVTHIGNGAFEENKLTEVTIGNNVVSIGEGAFYNNKIVSLVIPDKITSIEYFAFANNKLTKLTIGTNVTTIGQNAFYNNQLTNVTIPDSVTSIKNGAFDRNKLASVTIPDSVTSIGERAFGDARVVSSNGEDQPQAKRSVPGQNQNKLIALLANPMMAGSFGQFAQGERVYTTKLLLRIVDSAIIDNITYLLVRMNDANVRQPFFITTTKQLGIMDIDYPNTIIDELVLEFTGKRNYSSNGVPRETFVFKSL